MVLEAGLRSIMRVPVIGTMIAGWYGIDRHSTQDDYLAAAGRHPAFELHERRPATWSIGRARSRTLAPAGRCYPPRGAPPHGPHLRNRRAQSTRPQLPLAAGLVAHLQLRRRDRVGRRPTAHRLADQRPAARVIGSAGAAAPETAVRAPRPAPSPTASTGAASSPESTSLGQPSWRYSPRRSSAAPSASRSCC